jgi:hypothetical protein
MGKPPLSVLIDKSPHLSILRTESSEKIVYAPLIRGIS